MLYEKYKSKGVLVDTNLMVLVVIGSYSKNRILTFKRTIQYTLEDHDLILQIITNFPRRITTPHILAEVDNLTRQLPQAEHRAVSATIMQVVSGLFEVYVPSANAFERSRIPYWG